MNPLIYLFQFSRSKLTEASLTRNKSLSQPHYDVSSTTSSMCFFSFHCSYDTVSLGKGGAHEVLVFPGRANGDTQDVGVRVCCVW